MQIGGGSPIVMQGKKKGVYIKSCKDTVIKTVTEIVKQLINVSRWAQPLFTQGLAGGAAQFRM